MPSAADVDHCEWCHARIRWTVTAAGRPLAVNADPDQGGNTGVRTDGVGRVRSRALTADRPQLEGDEWQAMPHPATCPRPRTPRPRTPQRPVRRGGAWRWQR